MLEHPPSAVQINNKQANNPPKKKQTNKQTTTKNNNTVMRATKTMKKTQTGPNVHINTL